MTALSLQDCNAVITKQDTITEAEISDYLIELKQLWEHDAKTQSISRCFNFKNYYETMAFANATAWVSHQQNHHPDMHISYNQCTVIYTTHSIKDLSLNDFICAARINEIAAS